MWTAGITSWIKVEYAAPAADLPGEPELMLATDQGHYS